MQKRREKRFCGGQKGTKMKTKEKLLKADTILMIMHAISPTYFLTRKENSYVFVLPPLAGSLTHSLVGFSSPNKEENSCKSFIDSPVRPLHVTRIRKLLHSLRSSWSWMGIYMHGEPFELSKHNLTSDIDWFWGGDSRFLGRRKL